MMNKDTAGAERAGEEIPKEPLSKYLQEQLGLAGTLEVTQFSAGFSNLTYGVSVGDTHMVLRRPPKGANIATAHDMGREYRVLTSVKPQYDLAPRPIHFCNNVDIIGAPFFLMERVEGVILRGQLPKDHGLTPDWMQTLSALAATALAKLHQVDIQSQELASLGKPEGYIDRQVTGWIGRYQKAATDVIPEMDQMASWMMANQPKEGAAALIHNDFKYDNIVWDAEGTPSIKAILDWEMATLGDPLMDLGTTLAYWAEPDDPDIMKPYNPSWLPGNLNRDAFVQAYAEARGISLVGRDVLFYYVFGLFKVAVIGQQIYARFKAGYTKDPRFGMLIHAVKACAKTGIRALEQEKISQLW